ncbi:unnamed protein product [Rotaria sp. Silwood1]|nr:unnamed protein product [Rotaria sp. Silwood1]
MPQKKTKDENILIIDSKTMFLKRALEKLLSEKDIKKSQYQQLKRACETALTSITKDIQTSRISESSILPSTDQQSINAEKYFLPFELACTSNHPRMVDTSLDCLQKLLLHGHLLGSIADPIDPSKLLIDRIVSTICMCFRGVQTEEQVELQIIKALLTIMTSQVIEIHQRSVLQIIKTCFNIYLTSRSKINEATAQGSLSQMLNGIFSKMEQKMVFLNERRKQYQEDSTIITSNNIDQENVSTIVNEILDELVERICYDEATQKTKDTTLSTNEIIEDTQATQEEFHNGRSRNGLDSQSTSDPSSTKSTMSNSLSADELSADNSFKNAYYVFRALCKLSDRDIKDKTNTDPKTNLDLKSRIFSLRLIMQILQTSGPIFRSSEDFLYIIKTYLCVSLSRNGVSSIPELFEMALFNFVELLDKFKSYLKIQIEVLFREIFLTILETSTSSFRHKWLVIQTLAKISADAQIIVDLFINYDCSMRSANIFERLVIVLSRAAQGRQADELGCSPTEEHNLRMKGLECLVSILKCMVEWSNNLYVNPHLQSNLGPDSKPLHDNNYDQDSGRSSSGYVGNGIRRTDSSGSINSYHSNSGLSSESSKNVIDFELVRQRKELFEKGIDLFNQNSKKGLSYLYEKNLLNNEPEDIAQFFHSYQDILDKTIIGDCLGNEDNHFKQIMYAYVDQLDFTNMEFLAALRKFLSGFRLPGEAQKIDRLMEKFAARFCECNSHLEIFASADTAYVLAYSVIMLTTDLHSKNVKKKMTKEQYIKMNRGINESRDLPEEFLSKIYDEIENEEIKLKVTTLRRGANTVGATGTKENITSDKQRELLFHMQMKDIECVARDLMSNAGSSTEEFTIAKHLEHVRPMFQKAWSPCLAAFSVGLQDSDHIDLAHLCLTGISYSIRIACIFHMELERNAFIQALSRFTLLMTTSQVIEIKAKNVECLKILISVAQTDGNYLGDAWYDILKCISQLELAQLFGINANKARLNITNHQYQKLTSNSSSHTFSLPFDNLFYSEKDSSFDYAAVESASSQHNRMVLAGTTINVNSSTSDQQESILSNRLSPTNSIERSLKTQSDFHLFQILTIKCIVQLELIQTIDHIVFYPSTSKKEDLQNIAIAQALANVSSGQQNLAYFTHLDDTRDDYGMYNNMNLDQLLLLIDCLIESHMFARAFNSNHEQRNLLWKAGYRGKAKPNLLTQETHSIACAFRILFRLYTDSKRNDSMDILKRRILKLAHSSLEYYVTLQSESHRDAWTSVLILIFTKFLKLNEDRFKYFSGDIYSIVAEIVVFDLKPELRYILREFLLRVGRVFNVNSE